jgi:hypothetical protein
MDEPETRDRQEASLILDGLEIATGLVTIEGQWGCFWPMPLRILDIPHPTGNLTISGKFGELAASRFHRCPAGNLHYHFEVS